MMDWQQTYYQMATFAGLAGIISCGISIMLFVRTRPDRIKARIDAALAPVLDRLTKVEAKQVSADAKAAATSRSAEGNLRALDRDISARLMEQTRRADGQHAEIKQQNHVNGLRLERIATQLEHGVTRQELNTLHHRVTELAKQEAETSAKADGVAVQVRSINEFLMEEGSRG